MGPPHRRSIPPSPGTLSGRPGPSPEGKTAGTVRIGLHRSDAPAAARIDRGGGWVALGSGGPTGPAGLAEPPAAGSILPRGLVLVGTSGPRRQYPGPRRDAGGENEGRGPGSSPPGSPRNYRSPGPPLRG